MSREPTNHDVGDLVDAIYREECSRVLATLIRLLGDFDLAEEALHDAFAAAIRQWPADGIPDNPRAWLVSTGRFKAIDVVRKRSRFDSSQSDLADRLEADAGDPAEQDPRSVEDDHLRLIFTCCHPALSHDAKVALTLRTVCGLTTEEIAHAFLSPVATVAQPSSAPRRRSAAPASPTKYPAAASWRSVWTAYCVSFTWYSMKVTPLPPATR